MAAEKYYIYSGPPGSGLEGVPHWITESEAERLGVLETLAEAVKNETMKKVSKAEFDSFFESMLAPNDQQVDPEAPEVQADPPEDPEINAEV